MNDKPVKPRDSRTAKLPKEQRLSRTPPPPELSTVGGGTRMRPKT